MHNFNIGYGGIIRADRGNGTVHATACAYRRNSPRYKVCLPGVGLILRKGGSALVRLFRVLVVDMVGMPCSA